MGTVKSPKHFVTYFNWSFQQMGERKDIQFHNSLLMPMQVYCHQNWNPHLLTPNPDVCMVVPSCLLGDHFRV